MDKKLFAIMLLIISLLPTKLMGEVYDYDDSHIILLDQNIHLTFMLDLNKKEASLGTGLDDASALAYPPLDDPYWDPYAEGSYRNFWRNVVVPETVTYNNEIYTVTSVAGNAFYKAKQYIESIILPKTIKKIGGYAFAYCTDLKDMVIPDAVESIPSGCFYCCRSLESVKLPSALKSIESSAFISCVKLASVSIPGSCTQIGQDAFSWCIGMTNLVLEDGTEPLDLDIAYEFGPMWEPYYEPWRYSERFWRGMFVDSPLTNIYIGRNIQYSNRYAGFHIDSPFRPMFFDSVTFGETVTEIPNSLFRRAYFKSEIVLPTNVEKIGEYAFSDSYEQTKLIIPAKCKEIGKYAFTARNYGGTIKELMCLATTPPKIYGSTFGDCEFCVKVPEGTKKAYKEDPIWNYFLIIDPQDEMLSIDVKYAGSLYGRIAYLDLEPQDVSRLKLKGKMGEDDWSVLSEMSGLYELDLSELPLNNLSNISAIAKQLITIKLPNDLKKIEEGLFQNGFIQGELCVPATCSVIGANAFKKTMLNNIIIEGATNIGEEAFAYSTEVENIDLIGGATVNPRAFSLVGRGLNNNHILKKVTLGPGCIVKNEGFYSCETLEEIDIKDKVLTLEEDAFSYCNMINKITFGGYVTNFSDKAFGKNIHTIKLPELCIGDLGQWCRMNFSTSQSNPMSYSEKITLNGEKMRNVILPNNVTEVNDYVFSGCNSLEYIKLPDNVNTFGNGLFVNCQLLKEVYLPKSIRTIGDSLFTNCTSLHSISIPDKVECIGNYAFAECTSLQDVMLSQSLVSIGEYAFHNCSSLTNHTLPFSLNSIGGHAYEGCTAISYIEFPYNLKSIGDSAFTGCSNLKRLEALWINPFTITTNVFNSISKQCMMLVPVESVPNYYANGWGRIPLIDEGFCVIKNEITGGGHIRINGNDIVTGDLGKVDIGGIADISVVLDENCYVSSFQIDGQDALRELQNYEIELTEVNDNKVISGYLKTYLLGDVNDDDHIDVGDITAIVKFIQQTPEANHIAEAADVNRDRYIDVGDITGTVNLIYDYANYPNSLNAKSSTTSNSHNCKIYADASSRLKNKEGYMISVSMDNDFDVSGLQMEIKVPEELFLDTTFLSTDNNEQSRTKGMNIKSIVRLSNGNYQLLIASTKKTTISDNEGRLFTLPFMCDMHASSLENFDVKFDNIRVSDVKGNVLNIESFTVNGLNEVTRIEELDEDFKEDTRKYINNGQIIIRSNSNKFSVGGSRIR